MALYVPAGHKRRRAVIVTVAIGVVALVVGFAFGRATAPSFTDQVHHAQRRGGDLVARLESLPIEYEKAARGEPGAADVAALAAAIRYDAANQTASTPWITTAAAIDAKLAAVAGAATGKATPSAFNAAVDQAAATLAAAFGLPAPAPNG